jgi:Zn-dependent M28 family amino/carboxypeptidase
MAVPLVIIGIEHYGRMERLLDRHVPVKLELNVDTVFAGDHEEGFNAFGEIAGVDSAHKDEVVMVTAHLDSWAAGTGATDDGAGVVIAMEAMRILNALQVQPRRTIRIALWTGEEQGALGSRAYIARHLATVPLATTPAQLKIPEFLRRVAGPIVPAPDHARLSAVYNLDAGGGRIRGISVGNPALVPIFQQWVAPLQDLGMTLVASRSDCGGDCAGFARVGIPTPSFKQDPLDYDTRTHHTNMDTYEHLIPEDLRQAAVIVATMVYNTAMRDQMLPRAPLTP